MTSYTGAIMRPIDRLLVVAALVAGVSSLLVQFARPSAAHAAPLGPAELGPADALVLTDAKPAKNGPKEMKVRAEGGRVAWGDRSTDKAWSIGAVNVDKSMKAILAGTSYAEKRDEYDAEAKKQDDEYGKRFEDLRTKYQGIDPKSPEFPKAQQELEALRNEYMAWRDGSMKIREKLFSEQIEKAYRDLVAAVDIVAEREDIDLVFRFLPTGNPFEADSLVEAREQVIGRSLLKYPETIDITSEVMKELGIKE